MMISSLKKFDLVQWKNNKRLVTESVIQLSTEKESHSAVFRVDFICIGQGKHPDIFMRNFWYYDDGTAWDRQQEYSDIVKIEAYKQPEKLFTVDLK